jgi:hypothetical protein
MGKWQLSSRLLRLKTGFLENCDSRARLSVARAKIGDMT